MEDKKIQPQTTTPVVKPKGISKRGRKKKPIPEFKIEKAPEEKPIVVKFE